MDPYTNETLRLVGNRRRLRSCRHICDDIAASGPATPAEIARRSGVALGTVLACVTKMHQAGWVTLAEGVVSCNPIIDPFPVDL